MNPSAHAVLHDAKIRLAIASFLPSAADVLKFFSIKKAICFCSPEEKDRRTAVLRETFLSNLARGLAPFGVSVAQFLAALQADKASISGGFALGAVTGRFADGSDIDIYTSFDAGHAGVASSVMVHLAALLRAAGYALSDEADPPSEELTDYGEEMVGVDLVVRTAHCMRGGGREGVRGRSMQLIALPPDDNKTAEALEQLDRLNGTEFNQGVFAEGVRLYRKALSMPRQVQHFDLTVCCVSLSVSPVTGELQWSIPYLSDIAAGALAPTQYLVNHKRNLSKSEQKRNKILIRVAKYSARGYTPTAQLQQIVDQADRDVAKARARAAIEAAQGYGGRAAYIAKLDRARTARVAAQEHARAATVTAEDRPTSAAPPAVPSSGGSCVIA